MTRSPLSRAEDVLSAGLEERRWSYVGPVAGGTYIAKVPKGTPETTLAAAINGVEERRLAGNEADTLSELSAHDTCEVRVVPFVCRVGDSAVIVSERVPNLRSLSDVLEESPEAWAEPLGNLGAWLRRFHESRPGIAIDGLKLDNVELAADGTVILFDPNEFVSGDREIDLARFCISLLAWRFERGRLPSARSVEAAACFLVGYGLDAVDAEILRSACGPWLARTKSEISRSIDWRFRRPVATLGQVWARAHERLLERRADQLIERLNSHGVRQEAQRRYVTDEAVRTYRTQQERLRLRGLRLGLLARAEIVAVKRLLRAANAWGGHVLDVPAGTGKLWPTLRELGATVVAGDLSPAMLAAAGQVEGVQAVVLDARRLPFAEGSFDVVVSLRLMHRVPLETRSDALAEFARVSRRWVVVSFALHSGPRRVRYAVRTRLAGSRSWAPYPVTRLGLEVELQRAGLRPIRVIGVAGYLSNEVLVLAEKVEVVRRVD